MKNNQKRIRDMWARGPGVRKSRSFWPNYPTSSKRAFGKTVHLPNTALILKPCLGRPGGPCERSKKNLSGVKGEVVWEGPMAQRESPGKPSNKAAKSKKRIIKKSLHRVDFQVE